MNEHKKPEVTPADAAAIVDYIAGIAKSRPLQTTVEKNAATNLVESLGFKSHHDRQKNWDTFKCLSWVLSTTTPDDPVLDAGSGAKAVILQWLHRVGYHALYGCDLEPIREDLKNALGIRFSQQDLTATSYGDAAFQAITCISVIEHNVPIPAFATEMTRLLRPGGMLLISTDYWSEPVDCTGLYPYGEAAGEMKVFDPSGLAEAVDTIVSAGLELAAPVEYQTTEKAVRWERVDREYTFAFLSFRKPA